MIELLLGLGNVGERYVGTRHNVGFEVLDRVARKVEAKSLKPLEYANRAIKTRGQSPSKDREITLAWPLTLMNRSGWAVEELLDLLELEPRQMLVIVDDFNLPLGTLRFRERGSDGGHNGLASIIETLGTTDFPRLRLGIGPPDDNRDTADFVLDRFVPDEVETAQRMLDIAAEATLFAVDHRLQEAMSKYNVSPALPEE